MSRSERNAAAQAWMRKRLAQVLSSDRRIASFLAERPQLRIADVGCGRGHWLEYFATASPGAHLHGVDLDAGRLQLARASVPKAHLALADARALPWPDRSFDLAAQFVVFSSVLDRSHRAVIAREMRRVLKPGGLLLWFDFFAPNPLNRHTRPIRRAEIGTLFPDCRIHLQRVTLAAPLARFALRVDERLAGALEQWPFLLTHYLTAIEPKGSEEKKAGASTLLPSGDRRG